MFANIYHTIRRHIRDCSNLLSHRRENLKPHTKKIALEEVQGLINFPHSLVHFFHEDLCPLVNRSQWTYVKFGNGSLHRELFSEFGFDFRHRNGTR
jgi:hypothetical protein